ncbi:hypothetical protein NHX12_033696 [Muraenolepis orangiensis]|uniref:Calponin-homology (CH) domain-containing protein n=1 Tax=Muraenolepis orangiensis TaxID=630683 RepID=A0A9Q0IJ12_9TELE|nr:hypothetical protein NHX12_033696 [Muraenolepis orangiensis]
MTEMSQRGGCLVDFSPVRKDVGGDRENDDVPVLSLIQFSKAPFVCFGTVRLGSARRAALRLQNPTEDAVVEVTVDKISSAKGFSVDHNIFIIQPESSFMLTVTWTPSEEGGVRELIIFNANGVLKHQAVLLGRAEAPKKKKKSLWDSIKKKTAANPTATPRCKNNTSTLKITANKTFQVPRKPQYKREKPRSPLVLLNMGVAITERSLSKPSFVECGQELHLQRRRSKGLPGSDQAPDGHALENTPVLPLALAAKLADLSNGSAVLLDSLGTLENPGLTRVLNRTLSPVGTPEGFKRFMPRIQSLDSPVIEALPAPADVAVREPPVDSVLQRLSAAPTMNDALALIDSDLHTVSAGSSCSIFSDSLESVSASSCPAPVIPDSPDPSGGNGQRCTFFVSKHATTGHGVVSPVVESVHTNQEVKTSFTSATVTKSKATAVVAAPDTRSPGGRRIRKSRRRLLEKTLDLSEGSGQWESSPGTPGLPVIASDSGTESWPRRSHGTSSPHGPPTPVIFPITSPPDRSPAPRVGFTATSPSPEVLMFPVHTKAQVDLAKSKKRKSDEYLRSGEKVKDVPRPDCVKRSRVTVAATTRESMKLARARFLKAFGAPMRTAKIVAVAQAKLTFIKPAQTAIPRHPMPFAAKNMFYDERWIEKQESGFTCWINYILTPDDFRVNLEVTKVNALSIAMGSEEKHSVPKAPTKEELSFSTYTARRRLNRLRRSACQLFTSEVMVKAIQRLELEVEAKRLLVRKDRHLWKDIGERQKVLNWLLSYNPLWLRIGLETIYGELIPLESNSDVLGLAMFILTRLLWNPDIATKFRHGKVPHLYKDGHEEALSRFTLKKLLLFVSFLDKAKESRLIEHDPCLFCMDAEFKTSKDLLLAFSRDFLSGEGILPRHMGYLGLPVSHVQTPLDEFNFGVKNLAVDLKCGIRLVRVMELFLQDWSLSRRLRLPAISRLQKVHNVDIAFQVLKDKGVDLRDEHGTTIDSRDIVDGHREKTLSLLWKIIFVFQVEVILDEDQLREEISFLKRTLRTKQRLASLRADRGLQESTATRGPAPGPFETSSLKIGLLMEWVKSVCDYYSLRVENFTVSFSDGRVLCYLIHHYHPGSLPEKAISHSTTQTVDCSPRGCAELDCSGSDSDSSLNSQPFVQKELLDQEKNNFRLVNSAVAFLGGVPAMINPADMSNTIPNEKVVISYVSFLCSRLLDLRNETRAARVIQASYRRYMVRQKISEMHRAASVIQRWFRASRDRRRFLAIKATALLFQRTYRAVIQTREIRSDYLLRRSAAISLQAAYRGMKARWQLQVLHKAAVKIQSFIRMFLQRKYYKKLHWASTTVQCHYRTYKKMREKKCCRAHCERKQYLALKSSALMLQRQFRANLAAKSQLQHYQKIRVAVILLQAAYRGQQVRKEICRQHQAATVIQASFRKHREQVKFQAMRLSTIIIQRYYRSCVLQRADRGHFLKVKHSAIVLQAAFRGHCVRNNISKMQKAATVIQTNYRRCKQQSYFRRWRCAAVVVQQRFRAQRLHRLEEKNYQRLRRATITLQAAFHGMKTRQTVRRMHLAASAIQSGYRAHCERKQYLALKSSALTLQRQFRANLAAKSQLQHYQKIRGAVILLQAAYRGQQVRKEICRQHQAATVIQASFRKHREQVKFQAMRLSTIIIQRYYRSCVLQRADRGHFLKVKHSAIVLQAAFRGHCVRNNISKMQKAATVIQTNYRRCKQQSYFRRWLCAAVVVQQRFRAQRLHRLEEKNYQRLRRATITLQAAFHGMKTRQTVRRMHLAASAIQSGYRAHCERKQYLALKSSALTLQRQFRANLAAKSQLQHYQKIRGAVILLQATYRGQQVRKEICRQHQAATVIQASFRKHREQVKFQAMRLSTIIIQRYYRSCVLQRADRGHFLKVKHSAIVLQAAFRGHCVRNNISKMQKAATVIQTNYRRCKQQSYFRRWRCAAVVVQQRYRAQRLHRFEEKNYQRLRRATITLQAAFHGMKTRQTVRRMHLAASAIQSCYRAHCERKQYLALKSSALTLQRQFRANLAAKSQLQHYQKIRGAVIMLQATYRGQQVRKEICRQHQAATVIQASFRKHREQVKFQAMRLATIIIQRYYRSCVLQRADRGHFLKVKHSAIVLQAAFRGHCVRNNISKMQKAATVIQTNYRRCKQQSYFRRWRCAAVVVQQRFRAQRLHRLEEKNYQRLRRATITLQAAFHGMKIRQTVRRMHLAASAIQSGYRAHCDRKQYLALKSSALTLQRQFRANLAAKSQLQHYQKIRGAVILLQATYRGQQVRKEICRQHQAATVIQASFRKHREQVKFQAMRLSTIIIQRYYRSCVLQRADRGQFLKVKHSAIVLQAAFRGHCVRNNISKMQKAATVIQTNYRRCKQQSYFRRWRCAAVVVQQRYRAQRLHHLEEKNYQRLRRATITLQAAFHGMKTRQTVRRMHLAASAIQSGYRAHCDRKQYLALKSSALTLQRQFRANLAAKSQLQHYQKIRGAVIWLQATYRGQQVRKEICRQHQAATVIQASFRKHREQVKFQAMRLSTIIIQRYYRSCVLQRADRGQFLNVKHSAIVLQAAFRGHCVRNNISKMQKAATVIQTNYRRCKQQSYFRRWRCAAVVVQQRYRAQRLHHLEEKNYQRLRRATITLQAAFHGMKTRQTVRRMHLAASAIQSGYRAHCERKQYLALKSLALTLQRQFRANLAAKSQLQHYQKIRGALILLQAAYRGQQVRKEICRQHQAATVIQASFRKHREQVKFQAMRLSTIIIQRYYRSCVLQRADRGQFLKVKHSAIVLQAAFRGHCVRNNISKMQKAATVIQTNYRRCKQQSYFIRQRWAALVLQQKFRAQRMQRLEEKTYQRIRRATITLQAAFRGMKTRQTVRQIHQAASAIQRGYRAHCERKHYLALKSSALTLQQRFRANLAAKSQLEHYQKIRGAVILLQAAHRGQQVRNQISRQHQAATVIQASFRKHREQVKFQAMRLSTIIIQRYYRSCVLQRADRGHFLKVKRSAIVLQVAFRGHLLQRSIVEQNHAAILIQSRWRSLVQRLAYQRLREVAITLQRILRSVLLARAAKSHYTRKRRAAVTIQAHFRGWIARRKFLEAAMAEKRLRFCAAAFHHVSAIKIQRALRVHWALKSAKKEIHSVIAIQRWVRAKQQRSRYVEDRRKVVSVQRTARRWLARRQQAASVIQHAARSFFLRRRQQRILQGVVKAQALWRGHRSRKLSDDAEVVAARHRLRKVSVGVREEDKLGNKTASALDYLLRYKHFSCIFEALKNLETATRLSPECCVRLVESGATLVIFTLIRCCNRSVPCMEVISFSIQVLLNLSKYHKTVEAVYAVENCVETLLDLLQRYRDKAGDKVADKGGSIFTKACFLLALLLQDRHWALEVSKLPKALDRIRSIYRLTARKYRMDTERTIVKHKMNASTNSGFSVQATPRKSRPPRRFAPDWVLKKDKLRDVVDPLGAIQMVADTFSIVL